MSDLLKATSTRFRAYQLCQAGSSFSYFDGQKFTLIEAMANETSKPSLLAELALCGKRTIDTLHITSWDSDHCSETGLRWILDTLRPNKIEYPGYQPHTDCARTCLELLTRFQSQEKIKKQPVTLNRIDPPYIQSLDKASGLGYKDIIYHPKFESSSSNDNSTVKLFRSGMFNVLSLGDVQHANIGSMLRSCSILSRETDVMILAHHGADNGITTKKFLECVRPSLAICTSNYDNQYDHPHPNVRALLHKQEIRLCTTKTGDVIVESIAPHRSDYRVINLNAGSTGVSSTTSFKTKKSHLLSTNQDAVRNIYKPGFRGIKH
jgi:competence protein ComEC